MMKTYFLFLFLLPNVVCAQLSEVDLNRLEAEYGEQWSFCQCIVSFDSLHKALSLPELTDTEFDSLMIYFDSIDIRCKAFMAESDPISPEDRATHAAKVRNCLNQEAATHLYKTLNPNYSQSYVNIKEINSQSPLFEAEFYTRLRSFFGEEPKIIFGGFVYHIYDGKSNQSFVIKLDDGKFWYLSNERNSDTIDAIDRFHRFLFEECNNFVRCNIDFEIPKGRKVIGYMGGELFEDYYE